MNAKDALGKHGEQLAAEYLQQAGFRILDRNWRCADGEIDIVMVDRHILVVCEVKTRSGTASGTPREATTRQKVARLRHLAISWVQAHGVLFDEVRVDAVQVLRDRQGGFTIEHIRGVSNCSAWCHQISANICLHRLVRPRGWAAREVCIVRRRGSGGEIQTAHASSADRDWHDPGRGARWGGAGGVVASAQVSSYDQRAGLDRQAAWMIGWITGQEVTVVKDGPCGKAGRGSDVPSRPGMVLMHTFSVAGIFDGCTNRIAVAEERAKIVRAAALARAAFLNAPGEPGPDG